jgi:hypothetical protein
MKHAGGFKTLCAAACATAALLTGASTAVADAAIASPGPGATLRARYAVLKAERGHTQFHRPLYMDSGDNADGVQGDIHALVNYPFAIAGEALSKPSQWCDILILHINTKYCRPSIDGQRTLLHVNIGKKYDQPLDESYRVDFVYRVAARTADYLQVILNADEGPLATRNYRIVIEAAPGEDGRTFLRFSYSYSYGMVARVAMQVYLATVGRDKVGFTLVEESDGRPRYIGGMRGVMERNTMRYYLAIEAYLGALSVPPEARVEKSLRDWFAAIERYPRQLHEIEQGEYLDMKRREYSRQQVEAAAALESVAGDGKQRR